MRSTTLAVVGVFILVLATGSCSDNGHIPAAAWVGAAVVYLAGGAFGLQRAVRGIWVAPAAVLLAAFWLVAVATVLTGVDWGVSRVRPSSHTVAGGWWPHSSQKRIASGPRSLPCEQRSGSSPGSSTIATWRPG